MVAMHERASAAWDVALAQSHADHIKCEKGSSQENAENDYTLQLLSDLPVWLLTSIVKVWRAFWT